MKKYDGLYIFAGSARDEVLDKMVEAAIAEITNHSGNILSTEVLGKKTFARPMKKRDNGVYVKIRFEIDPAAIEKLTKRYKLIEDVFRVQFLAVDERLETVLAEQADAAVAREVARTEAAAAATAAAAEAAAAKSEEIAEEQ
jgi:small subunit ribosomal protein S6